MVKIPPFSFSSLSKFETCPRQYYLTRVAKLVREPPTVHTTWGNDVHKAIEERVKNKKPLPGQMEKWEQLVAPFDIVKGVVSVEQKLSLTRNLTPTGWFDPSAWCRAIIDLSVDAGKKSLLLDWKTGKVKSDVDQLRLSTAIWLKTKPYVEKVYAIYMWLAHGKATPVEFTRDDAAEIIVDFTVRSRRLEESYERDRWLPKPSGLCNGWCPVGKQHCEFWSPKK